MLCSKVLEIGAEVKMERIMDKTFVTQMIKHQGRDKEVLHITKKKKKFTPMLIMAQLLRISDKEKSFSVARKGMGKE